MRKIENKLLKKYSQVYPSTKLVVWVLLKGTLKLIPLKTCCLGFIERNPETDSSQYRNIEALEN